ncbi:MAG: ABC transporter permease [Silvanigrellaceae bacterium]
MQTLKMGYKNIIRNWRHSFGSILSVAIGFTSLTLFNGYISVIEDLYEDNYKNRSMFGDVFVEKTRNGKPVDFEESKINKREQHFLESFFAQSGMVDAYVPVLIINGMANNGRTSSIFWGFAYDRQRGLEMRKPSWPWNVRAGRPLDTISSEHVLLGQDIGDTFGCMPEKKEQILTQVGGYEAKERPFKCDKERIQLSVTTESGQVNATNVSIGALGGVGLRGIDSWYLMMDLDRAHKLYDTSDISHIRLRLKDSKQFSEFIDLFNKSVHQEGLEIRAFDWREHILARVYKRTMSLFTTFRNLVSLVILTISGMSVLNSMVKSINERQREIGTLLSLGFLPGQVRSMFVAEGLVIGVAGSFVGSFFSVLFSLLTNKIKFIYYAGFLSDPVPFLIGLVPLLYFLSLIILCSIAGLTAFVAANRTVKTPIPQLLTAS